VATGAVTGVGAGTAGRDTWVGLRRRTTLARGLASPAGVGAATAAALAKGARGGVTGATGALTGGRAAGAGAVGGKRVGAAGTARRRRMPGVSGLALTAGVRSETAAGLTGV